MKFSRIYCGLAAIVLVVLATPCHSPIASLLKAPPASPTPAPVADVPPASAETSHVSEAVHGPERIIAIIEPPRKWIVSAETWQRINDSRFSVDLDVGRGREYVGVRYMIPFGS